MLENLIVYLRTRPAAVLGDVCGQFLGGAVWHFGRCGYFWIHAVVYRGQTQSESEFQVFYDIAEYDRCGLWAVNEGLLF